MARLAGFSYRPEIDGLRAVAVLSVILFHADLALPGGYIGVDVFFVISGYLITSLILAERKAGTFTFLGFYERRMRRIAPALILVLGVCVPFALLWMNPLRLTFFAESVISVAAMVSNAFFWKFMGYFSETEAVNPLLHTWSLAVEEQFYLFFPVFLVALLGLSGRATFLGVLTLTVVSLAACIWVTPRAPSAAFFLTPFRIWELLVGALIAQGHFAGYLTRDKRTDWPACAAGLAMIAAAALLFDEATAFPGAAAILPVAGTALIVAFAQADGPIGRLLASRPVVTVGLISYSAYLWHQPAFAFARIRGIEPVGAAGKLALIAAILGLAYLSWRFVEQPFRDRSRTGGLHLKRLALVGILIALGVGATGMAGKGLRDRYPEDVLQIADEALYSPLRGKCHTEPNSGPAPGQACAFFEGSRRWAVLGDSQGVEPAFALAEALRPRGEGLVQMTHSNCPPSFSFGIGASCRDWTKAAVARITSDPQIRNVVVIYRHAAYLYGQISETYPRLPDRINFQHEADGPEAARQDYWRSFRALVETLEAAGKQVFVVYPLPVPRDNMLNLIFPPSVLADARLAPEIVGMRRAKFDALTRPVFAQLDSWHWHKQLAAIRPHERLCDDENCYAMRGNIPLYYDGIHLSLHGARNLAQQILAAAGD